jgi:hypothetical protein
MWALNVFHLCIKKLNVSGDTVMEILVVFLDFVNITRWFAPCR